MGRHPECLGSSLFRLSMVRLYDQSNIAYAHDDPIPFRMHIASSRLPMFKVLSAASGPGFCGRRRSNTMMELMGHSGVYVVQLLTCG